MNAAHTLEPMGAAKRRPSGKSFSDEENARIRAAAQVLLDRYGTMTALGRVLGVSQPTVSTFLRAVAPDGAGVQLAEAVARETGVTLDELRSGRRGEAQPAGTVPCFGDLPGWAEAEAEAREKFGRRLPAYAWQVARSMMGAQAPAKIDAVTVFGLTSSLWEMMGDDVRAEALRRQAEAEMAAEDDRMGALLKDRAHARATGAPVPPLPDDPAAAAQRKASVSSRSTGNGSSEDR